MVGLRWGHRLPPSTVKLASDTSQVRADVKRGILLSTLIKSKIQNSKLGYVYVVDCCRYVDNLVWISRYLILSSKGLSDIEKS